MHAVMSRVCAVAGHALTATCYAAMIVEHECGA